MGQDGPGPVSGRADRLTSQVDELAWTRCSAGDGAKGPRVYDWAVVEIRPLGEPDFVCFGPAGTALEELVRVAVGLTLRFQHHLAPASGKLAEACRPCADPMAPEVRRLLTRLVWTENQLPDFPVLVAVETAPPSQSPAMPLQTPPVKSATVVLVSPGKPRSIGVNDSCRLTMLTLGGSGHGTSFPTGGVDIPRARLAGWPMLIRGPVDRSGTA